MESNTRFYPVVYTQTYPQGVFSGEECLRFCGVQMMGEPWLDYISTSFPIPRVRR
jgi:hypothetical protein